MRYALLFILSLQFCHADIPPSCLDPTPYLLPRTHPLRPKLDAIFKKKNVLQNQQTFEQAGFKTLYLRPTGHVRIAKHPAFPKHIFKVYLQEEFKQKGELTNDQWLTQRCFGADQIRQLIKRYSMKYLTVPNKWLYAIPKKMALTIPTSQFILIADDMQILSPKKSRAAWLEKATAPLIRELYLILKSGYGSGALPKNVPFTKSGRCTFIDTEFGKRSFHLPDLKRHLSPKMQQEWDLLL